MTRMYASFFLNFDASSLTILSRRLWKALTSVCKASAFSLMRSRLIFSVWRSAWVVGWYWRFRTCWMPIVVGCRLAHVLGSAVGSLFIGVPACNSSRSWLRRIWYCSSCSSRGSPSSPSSSLLFGGEMISIGKWYVLVVTYGHILILVVIEMSWGRGFCIHWVFSSTIAKSVWISMSPITRFSTKTVRWLGCGGGWRPVEDRGVRRLSSISGRMRTGLQCQRTDSEGQSWFNSRSLRRQVASHSWITTIARCIWYFNTRKWVGVIIAKPK